MDDSDRYFNGELLYGDDFDANGLQTWWSEEEEGYAGIHQSGGERPYGYHALHELLFFRRFPSADGAHVLGLGSALGHELTPLLPKLARVVIVDPSGHFASNHVLKHVDVSYLKARVDGRIEQPDASFDLVTCFGVLHHIANVSFVLAECHRVLKPGGMLFCREPIVTQGDWRKPRPGLTKNERGIPHALFRSMIERTGFGVELSRLCDFAPYRRLMAKAGLPGYDSRLTTQIDLALASLFSFNTRYHRPGFLAKFGPASVAYVLRKRVAV